MDEKDIVDYFSGKTSECKQIDASLRAQLLIKKSDLRTGKIAVADTV
jgi:RecB family exonuclease